MAASPWRVAQAAMDSPSSGSLLGVPLPESHSFVMASITTWKMHLARDFVGGRDRRILSPCSYNTLPFSVLNFSAFMLIFLNLLLSLHEHGRGVTGKSSGCRPRTLGPGDGERVEPSASKVKTSVGFLSLPGFLHLVPPRSVQPQSHRPDANNPNPYGRLLRSLTCPQVWPGAGVPGCPGHLENVTLRPCPSRWGAGEGKGAPPAAPPARRPLFRAAVVRVLGRRGLCRPFCCFTWFRILFLKNPKLFICEYPLGVLQDVKVFSEDGTCKVVEIPTDMTARDLCQLLVYRSHCVDDNSWTLVEHHPHLGLGRNCTWERSACT